MHEINSGQCKFPKDKSMCLVLANVTSRHSDKETARGTNKSSSQNPQSQIIDTRNTPNVHLRAKRQFNDNACWLSTVRIVPSGYGIVSSSRCMMMMMMTTMMMAMLVAAVALAASSTCHTFASLST